jgi:hypothetical protein
VAWWWSLLQTIFIHFVADCGMYPIMTPRAELSMFPKFRAPKPPFLLAGILGTLPDRSPIESQSAACHSLVRRVAHQVGQSIIEVRVHERPLAPTIIMFNIAWSDTTRLEKNIDILPSSVSCCLAQDVPAKYTCRLRDSVNTMSDDVWRSARQKRSCGQRHAPPQETAARPRLATSNSQTLPHYLTRLNATSYG